jgi:hypothetical protein
MDFKELEATLKGAPQSLNVRLARKRISDLKPVLAYAFEEIKALDVEERGEITTEVLTPEEIEAAKNIEVDAEVVLNNEELLDPETKKLDGLPQSHRRLPKAKE